MKCNVAALLSLLAVSSSSAFVTKAVISSVNRASTSCAGRNNVAFVRTNEAVSSSPLAMATVETNTDYDIVKVDLSDGRDYPIYIGDGFDDAEAGKILRSHITGNRALLVTNDLIEPLYLAKYEKLLKEGGNIQIGMFLVMICDIEVVLCPI